MFKKIIKKLKFAFGKPRVANDVNGFKEFETQKIGKCE